MDRIELLKKVDPTLYARVVRALETAARQLPDWAVEELERRVAALLNDAERSGWAAPLVPSSGLPGGRLTVWFWRGPDGSFQASLAGSLECPKADAEGLLEVIGKGQKPRFVAWRKVK